MDEAVAEGVTGHLTATDPSIHLYSGLHSQRLFGLAASERCKARISHVDIGTH